MTILDSLAHQFHTIFESPATPMPMATAGLASASSLAGSLKAGHTYDKMSDQMPKLGLGKGSSFVSERINQVLEGSPVSCSQCGNCCGFIREGSGWKCQDCSHVMEAVMSPREIEFHASNVSPVGQRTPHDVLMPGAQIGLRGPTHNGHHAVVSVTSTHVTLKNDQGYEETIPISYLDDHEVVHSLETV